MTTASLARCPSCRAIVNAHWETCLACRKPLEADCREKGASSLATSSWLQQWRDLAQVSMGLTGEDPRYDPLLAALGACHHAYKAGEREQFAKHAEDVVRIAAFVPGSVVQWRGHDKKLHGPSTITEVIVEDGRLWAWVKWKGQLYWVCDSIIESIQPEGKANPRAAVRTL